MSDAVAQQAAEDGYRRRIQTFVRREGRTTVAQTRALADILPLWQWPNTCAEPATVFGRVAPTTLEIGFGAGENLLAQAVAQPAHNFIGLEVHRPGVGQLLHRAHSAGLSNLRVSTEDALEFLRERLPVAALDVLQIWFPDPWHKKRHHKRRIIQADNLSLFARAVKPGGLLRMATDWENYAEWMREHANPHPQWQSLAADGGYVARCPDRILTRFEARGLRLGHSVFDLAYRRR